MRGLWLAGLGVLLAVATPAIAELLCLSCSAGFFLDQAAKTCRRCPANASTFDYSNASAPTDCSCTAGFFNTSAACAPCARGTFKGTLRNASCTPCMANANTSAVASVWVSDCLCNPGFTAAALVEYPYETCVACAPGLFKGVLGDEPCTQCPADSYCPRQSVEPQACPINSVSAAGTTSVYGCTCVPGFRHRYFHSEPPGLLCVPCESGTFADGYNTTTCSPCPADTFFNRTGAASEAECVACPAHAVSATGSSNRTECFCVLGYAGLPGDECVACQPGTFRDDPTQYICEACPVNTYNVFSASNDEAACLACPFGKTSVGGSDAELDCVCREGSFATLAADGLRWECRPCAAGTFQTAINASSCDACPAGTASDVEGADDPAVCARCDNGYYALEPASTACAACAPGEWQDLADPARHSAACEPCPGNSSHALSASTDVHDCVCFAGFVKFSSPEVPNRCDRCRPGSFCPGNGTQVVCPYNSWAPGGVFSGPCVECAEHSRAINEGDTVGRHQCQCVPGAGGAYDSECALCPPGEFQPLNHTYPDGADFVQGDAAVATTCRPCPAGTYNDARGAHVCTACPAHSNASTGTDALSGCTCVPSYYGPDGGPCAGCPADSFCLGGVAATQCRPHSNSPPLSSAAADCKCDPGYYSNATDLACRKCPPGFYCHGDQHIAACAANSSSPAGASAASACTCAPGMWRECILQQSTGAYLDADGQPCTIDWLVDCVTCAANDICLKNTLLHCPDHSTAPAGSADEHDCVCDDGYYNVFHHAEDAHAHEVDYEHSA